MEVEMGGRGEGREGREGTVQVKVARNTATEGPCMERGCTCAMIRAAMEESQEAAMEAVAMEGRKWRRKHCLSDAGGYGGA